MKISTLQTLLEKIQGRFGDIDVMTRIPICRYEATTLTTEIEMRVTKPEIHPCLVLEG